MSQEVQLAGAPRCRRVRASSYRRWPVRRPWQRLTISTASSAAIVLIALATGGCSFSYKLGSLFGDKEDEKPELTSSTVRAADATRQGAGGLPAESDLGIAKAAAAEALARGGKDVSVPWENPKTGARGTVTPIALAYTRDGFVCRDFLASFIHAGTEAWLQGEACRIHQGRWEVRALKPLKRS